MRRMELRRNTQSLRESHATIDALNRTTWNSYDNSRRLKEGPFQKATRIEYTYDVRSNALTEQPHVKPNSGMR